VRADAVVDADSGTSEAVVGVVVTGNVCRPRRRVVVGRDRHQSSAGSSAGCVSLAFFRNMITQLNQTPNTTVPIQNEI
jgi:hypothetical protein